jgi:phosphopantothenate synthetase
MDIAKKLVMSNLHNLYKGRYGIAIAMSNFSPTAKSANMNMLFELSRVIPGIIPPAYLIKQSDLPDKEQILKEIDARAKAAQQAELNKVRQEIEGKILLQEAKNAGTIANTNTQSKNDFVSNRANPQQ